MTRWKDEFLHLIRVSSVFNPWLQNRLDSRIGDTVRGNG